MVNAAFLGAHETRRLSGQHGPRGADRRGGPGAGDRKRAAARGRARLLPRRAAADRPPAAAAAAGDRHPPHRARTPTTPSTPWGAWRSMPAWPSCAARGRRTWSTPRFTQARTGHDTHPVFRRHRPGHRQLQDGRRGRHRPRPRLRGWASTRRRGARSLAGAGPAGASERDGPCRAPGRGAIRRRPGRLRRHEHRRRPAQRHRRGRAGRAPDGCDHLGGRPGRRAGPGGRRHAGRPGALP